MMEQEMRKEAYLYEPGDYIKTSEPNPEYWVIIKRQWNHDANKDWYPLEHREYVIQRLSQENGIIEITITEKDALNYEPADKHEVKQ